MGYGKPYTELYCHLVWATYGRLPLIHVEDEARLYEAIRAKAAELRCDVLAVGGTMDHLHVVCHLHPTVSVSVLVQQIKGASSHLMTHAVLGPESFRWQGSYGAFTLQKNAVQVVCRYVLDQKRHHASDTLWPRWETSRVSEG